MFENLLALNQIDYWNHAKNDFIYTAGSPGESTTLYDQQLAGYNASVMKGGRKKTRKGSKTKRRRRFLTRATRSKIAK